MTTARRRGGLISPYQLSFVKQSHVLLAEGFERLDRRKIGELDEESISGRLSEAIQKYTEAPGAPLWATRFAIHNEAPSNRGPHQGKRRPRIDLLLQRTEPGPHPRLYFETKRLYRSDSAARYVGDDGVGCFISGHYASDCTDAGMVGYVQRESVAAWSNRIETRMKKMRRSLRIVGSGAVWIEETFDTRLSPAYKSTHLRTDDTVTIHHSFLDCISSPGVEA